MFLEEDEKARLSLHWDGNQTLSVNGCSQGVYPKRLSEEEPQLTADSSG